VMFTLDTGWHAGHTHARRRSIGSIDAMAGPAVGNLPSCHRAAGSTRSARRSAAACRQSPAHRASTRCHSHRPRTLGRSFDDEAGLPQCPAPLAVERGVARWHRRALRHRG
jgi:hypothetical protein